MCFILAAIVLNTRRRQLIKPYQRQQHNQISVNGVQY